MKRFKATLAFAILAYTTVMGYTLHAQGIDRTQRPAADPAPEISFPPFETFKLDNGLKVFLVHDPRPSVTMRLLVRGGNSVVDDQTGLGDAVADLMTKGVGEMSAQEFAEEIDFIGGSIGASASEDAISIRATGLKKHLNTIADLFATVVMKPTYPEDELEKYKAIQIDGLRASKKQSDFIAEYAVNKVLFGDAAFARMPTEESINEISRDDILAYHQKYVVPQNATLAVVGDLTVSEVKNLLNKRFEQWNKGQSLPPVPATGVKLGEDRVVLVDRPTSVQSAIRIVGPGPDYTNQDRTRAFLLNSILGGGTGLGNRLAMNLRETHGWTYSPYSYFTANMFGGSFVAAADVSNNVTDSAIVQMIMEINRLASESVEEGELTLNIQSTVGGYLMSLASAERTASRVQSVDFYGLPTDYYEKLVEIYTTTTSDNILDIARKYFRQDDMAIVVVGKASEVQDMLTQFGPVTLWDENLQPVKAVSAADVGMSASDAWEKMLGAMGGKDELQKVKSLSMQGNAVLEAGPQQIPGTYTMVQAYPGKEFIEIKGNFNGQSITFFQQFTSENAASQYQMGQKIPMEEEDQQKQIASAHILMEAWLDEMDAELELQGIKEVDGRELLMVAVKREGVDDQVYYIDRETYLPYRIFNGPASITYPDWGTIEGGIMQPSVIILDMGEAVLTVDGITYTVNQKTDDKIFEGP